MNKLLYSIILVFCCWEGYSQMTSIPLNLKTNDLVYDSITDKIYVTIPSSDAFNGNSIGIVNPHTNVLENTLLVGDEPTVMDISDDGQYIYVGFNGVSKIKRYKVNPLSFDMEFNLGADPYPYGYGNYFAWDIAVMPGQPNVISVARKFIEYGYYESYAGIGIYENGIMRPIDIYRNYIGIRKIKFKNSNTLIGHYGNGIPSHTSFFTVNSNGITLAKDYEDMPNPHPYGTKSDFVCKNDRLYFMNGKIINTVSTAFLEGQFSPNATGAVVYDEFNNLVCFGYSSNIYTYWDNSYSDGYLKRFNPTTLQLVDSYQIKTYGEIDKMITCGDGCLAMVSNADGCCTTPPRRLTIVRDQSLKSNDFTSNNQISIYPNPTSDFINIKNIDGLDIKNISIYNSFGKIVLNNSKNDLIDMRSFSNGVYFCKITDMADNSFTTKIIKN